jgi:hypothetical protein
MQTMGTEEFLTSTAKVFWIPAVTRWAPGVIEPGKPLVYKVAVVAPVGGFSTSMNGSVEIVSQAQCKRGDTSRRCVFLRSTETADPDEMRKGIAAFVATKDANVDMSDVKSVTLRNEMEAVTEPDTLIPRRVLFIKKVTVEFSDGDGTRTANQEERREWFFDCKEPSLELGRPR